MRDVPKVTQGMTGQQHQTGTRSHALPSEPVSEVSVEVVVLPHGGTGLWLS